MCWQEHHIIPQELFGQGDILKGMEYFMEDDENKVILLCHSGSHSRYTDAIREQIWRWLGSPSCKDPFGEVVTLARNLKEFLKNENDKAVFFPLGSLDDFVFNVNRKYRFKQVLAGRGASQVEASSSTPQQRTYNGNMQLRPLQSK
jgi:hypothetical protein